MSLAIETNNLSKSFNKNLAINHISLSIKEGICTGLVGHNGAGKTTLFSLICGFLKADQGTINILGQKPASTQLSGQLAILPQDASFIRGIKIGKQLTMLAELQGFNSPLAIDEAKRVLAIVKLENQWNKLPENLSHGMHKRLAIAQAFIGNPKLILLDEPTAGLDPQSAKKIKDFIRQQQSQITFVISSHNLEDIEDLCQEIIILKKGKVTHHDKVAELTDRTSALTFRLENDPKHDIENIFKNIAQVKQVDIGNPGERRITVYFEHTDNGAMLEIDIIKCLAEAGIAYREMTRGMNLSDKILDLSK